jgi:hypothetical protein
MSFRCAFCNKAQGKGKRPTLLITGMHEVVQYDRKGRQVCTTIEVKSEKPACEACCQTTGGQQSIEHRKELGQPIYPRNREELELEESLLDLPDEGTDA